jgi:hypothetical protein
MSLPPLVSADAQARVALWQLLPEEIVDRIVAYVNLRMLGLVIASAPNLDADASNCVMRITRCRRVCRAFREGLRVTHLLLVSRHHSHHIECFSKGVALLLWDLHDDKLRADQGDAHLSCACTPQWQRALSSVLRRVSFQTPGPEGGRHFRIDHGLLVALTRLYLDGKRRRPASLATTRMISDTALILCHARARGGRIDPELHARYSCSIRHVFRVALLQATNRAGESRANGGELDPFGSGAQTSAR